MTNSAALMRADAYEDTSEDESDEDIDSMLVETAEIQVMLK